MKFFREKFAKLFGESQIENTFGIKFTSKTLLALLLPLVAEQFLGMLMGIVDTVMVSGLGDEAVSGVALIDMIFHLCFSVFNALCAAGAVVASRYIGAGRPDRACHSAAALLTVAAVVSGAVYGIIALWDRGLVSLLFGQIEPGVMDNALTYMRVTSLSFPAVALYSACAALYRSMGNSKISMYASAVANVMNMACNALLIYGLKWGVVGAALATVFSRVLLAVFFMVKIFAKNNLIRADFMGLIKTKPREGIFRQILSIGAPGSLESGTFQLGRILVLSLISTFGTAEITANAVAGNIDAFGIITGHAFNLAIVTVIGQCVGRGDWRAVEYYTKKMLRMSWAMMLGFNIILFASLPLLLSMYKVSAEAKAIATVLIWIHNGMGVLLWTPSFVLPNAMKATGDATFVMVVAMLSMFIFRVGLSQVLGGALGWGAVGVWCAMVVDWIARVICFGIRWRKQMKKKNPEGISA